jgi:hypothetical protein
MTEPTPAQATDQPTDQPTDHRYDPPPSGAELVDERPPPATEAERQAQATVRSVSRLEESS